MRIYTGGLGFHPHKPPFLSRTTPSLPQPHKPLPLPCAIPQRPLHAMVGFSIARVGRMVLLVTSLVCAACLFGSGEASRVADMVAMVQIRRCLRPCLHRRWRICPPPLRWPWIRPPHRRWWRIQPPPRRWWRIRPPPLRWPRIRPPPRRWWQIQPPPRQWRRIGLPPRRWRRIGPPLRRIRPLAPPRWRIRPPPLPRRCSSRCSTPTDLGWWQRDRARRQARMG
jgi:hypothetical protein